MNIKKIYCHWSQNSVIHHQHFETRFRYFGLWVIADPADGGGGDISVTSYKYLASVDNTSVVLQPRLMKKFHDLNLAHSICQYCSQQMKEVSTVLFEKEWWSVSRGTQDCCHLVDTFRNCKIKPITNVSHFTQKGPVVLSFALPQTAFTCIYSVEPLF